MTTEWSVNYIVHMTKLLKNVSTNDQTIALCNLSEICEIILNVMQNITLLQWFKSIESLHLDFYVMLHCWNFSCWQTGELRKGEADWFVQPFFLNIIFNRTNIIATNKFETQHNYILYGVYLCVRSIMLCSRSLYKWRI